MIGSKSFLSFTFCVPPGIRKNEKETFRRNSLRERPTTDGGVDERTWKQLKKRTRKISKGLAEEFERRSFDSVGDSLGSTGSKNECKGLASYLRCRSREDSLELLATLERRTDSKTFTYTCNQVILELGKMHDFNTAKWLFDTLLSEDEESCRSSVDERPSTSCSRTNPYTYVSLFKAASFSGRSREGVKIWHDRMSKGDCLGSVETSALLSSCCSGDVDLGFRVLKSMVRSGAHPNLYCYNALLSASTRNKNADVALQVFKHLRDSQDCRPDVYSFAQVTNCLVKCRRYAEAQGLYDLLQVENIVPDEVLWGTFLNAAAKTGNVELATRILEDALSSGCTMNHQMWNMLMDATARSGKWQRAMEILQQMKGMGMVPDSYSYTSAMLACQNGGAVQGGLDLYDKMKAEGIQENGATFTVLAGLYRKCSMYHEALQIPGMMRTRGIPGNARVYNAVICCCIDHMDVRGALMTLEEMQEHGVLPTEVTFRVLIRACEDAKLLDKANELSELRESLRTLGVLSTHAPRL